MSADAKYIWDEAKRRTNLAKHGLDFMDADMVLANPYRLETDSIRNGEPRKQVFAYVFEVLAVLTAVYLPGQPARIISFRRAHRKEQGLYYDWLENYFDDA
jgi:uncharacterized DUF497 family protein